MSIFSRKIALAVALAALCPGARTAHAQAAPVRYWIPSGPFGFGGNLNAGPGLNAYGNFPGFDGSGALGDGSADGRTHFPNGWFVGGEGGGLGLSMNGINQLGAFGNFPSLSYQGVQFGYTSHIAGGLPLTVYGGFDTLKYDAGSIGPFAAFDSNSNALPGYSMRAGVEFRPTSNLSLSLGVGYTQQPGYSYGDINSLALSGAPPLAFGRH